MANANFKNTIVDIKNNKMYIMIDLDVVLESDTVKIQAKGTTDAVCIANTYQEDVNDDYHINVQVNTNTKANKEIFKAKKQALKDAVKKEQAPKTKKAKKTTVKAKAQNLIRVESGLVLDLNNEWDARKYAKILARG